MLSINSFQTYLVGANRPVGQYLSRTLAAQNLSCKGYLWEQRESLSPFAVGRPFLVLLPSVFSTEDFEHLPFWLAQAQKQDMPVFLLSSLAIFPARQDVLWQEQDTELADTELAWKLHRAEEQVRQLRRHLILRVGQEISLAAEDFTQRLLAKMREQQALELDAQSSFSPTCAEDSADVMLAMLKQVNCCDTLWGTYHFNAVEPISPLKFAEAFLGQAQQYEQLAVELSLSEGGYCPEVCVPNGDSTKLFYSFGVKSKSWRKKFPALVQRYYQGQKPL